MFLDAQQTQQFQQWLKNHGPGGMTCPCCYSNEWVPPTLGTLPGVAPGDTGWAVVCLTCASCGHVRLFSTTVIGLARPRSW
jgi:hypothetical protein